MRPILVLSVLLVACNAPRQSADAAPAPDGATLIVLNKSDATASLIDAASGETRAVVATGAGPHEVAVHEATAVVCDYGDRAPGNTLTVIDVARAEVVRTIDLGRHRRPHGIQFEDDGRHVIVTTEDSRSLVRVDVLDGEVAGEWSTDQSISHMVALTPARAPDRRARAFVANIRSGTVTAIDLATGRVLKQIATGRGAEGIDVTPDGREVWVTNRAEDTLSIVDARSLEIEATLPCGQFPIRIKFTPDGLHALVSNANSGDVAVFDVEGRREVARVPMDLTAVETEDRLFAEFGDSPTPVGILISPGGERAYVANTNADIVTVLDLETLTVIGRIATGKEPDGLGWSPSAPIATKP
jgi:YVTN family beta-propeller protein